MGSSFSYISYIHVHVQCKYMYVPSKEYGFEPFCSESLQWHYNFMLIYMCVIQKWVTLLDFVA